MLDGVRHACQLGRTCVQPPDATRVGLDEHITERGEEHWRERLAKEPAPRRSKFLESLRRRSKGE